MRTANCVVLLLLTAGLTLSLAQGFPTYQVTVHADKCQPHYTLTISPTSATVPPGSNVSFIATIKSVCKLPTISIQYARTLMPQVTNGPQLPPNSCYAGCNIIGLPGGATIQIGTTIKTSLNTPTGTYTFTFTANPDSCPAYTDCTQLSRSVDATLTVG